MRDIPYRAVKDSNYHLADEHQLTLIFLLSFYSAGVIKVVILFCLNVVTCSGGNVKKKKKMNK